MRRITLRATLIVVGLVAALPFMLGPMYAQTLATKSAVSDLERPIHNCEQQVTSWRREGMIEISCVIAALVFGVLITALQKSTNSTAKTVTAILGVVTAILAGVNSRVFSADDRTLKRAAFDGSAVISQLWVMDDTLKDEHVSTQDKLNVKGEYLKKLLEFQAIGERLNGSAVKSATDGQAPGVAIMPTVFAMASVATIPAWATNPPSDAASLYFVGKAYDSSLANAKQNSLNDAMYRAAQELKKSAPDGSGTALLDLVKSSGVVQDSAFLFDAKAGTYTVYTLFRISREIQGIGLKSLPVSSVVANPPEKIKSKGWQPADLTANVTSGLFALDSSGGVSKVTTDAKGSSHLEKLFQLRGTDSGDALTASADAVFVASSSRLGCTIYKYTLASKVVASKLAAVRQRCVGIANDGKALYVTLPDQKEILYFDTWDAASSHSWPVTQTSSPGFLIYDALGQRLIFADDAGKAYAVSVPDGKIQELASNLGAVQSITTSKFHILIASGTKVLFLARSDNHGENPPADLQTLTGGHIVGVTVDAADKLWFADYDNKLIEGPYPLL